MKKVPINIPEGVYYLGSYPEISHQLPTGKYVFNKCMPGCGATTLFLDDETPTVLCSPRKELIRCKAYSNRYLGKVHLFGDIKSDKVIDKINAVKSYINTCGLTPFSPHPKIAKILVTYDSTKHVIQALTEMGVLDKFRFVVDEFQTLWTDAAFRGDTEAEFMENLRPIKNVVFLSATPYLEDYLDMCADFKALPYVELKWPESSVRATHITPELYYDGSPTKTIKRIIDHFKNTGYFEETMDASGNTIRSTEAVFFVNKVKFIIDTIKKNGLSPADVNIICSERDDNLKKLKTAGLKLGHAPKEGDPHCAYTFVTKASYEGTDFYSTCAYTYIFSDIKQDSMAIDISLDLPQIMGRQRLCSNPFRYSATLFLKIIPEFTEEKKKEYMDNVMKKDKETKDMLEICDSLTPDQYILQAKTLRSAQAKDAYTSNYVTVVDDKTTNQPKAVYNEFVMQNELRAWDVQMHQYTDTTYVMAAVDSAFIGNGTSVYQGVMQFMSGFCGTFEQKMKAYAEFCDTHPECKDELQQEVRIPAIMKEAYNLYGTDRLRSLSWKESAIKVRMVQDEEEESAELKNEIYLAFPGSWYSLPDIKSKLQEIYSNCGIIKRAKATDIEQFFPDAIKRKNANESGRANGYQIRP